MRLEINSKATFFFCFLKVKTKGGRWSPFTLPASLCRTQFTLYDMKDADRTLYIVAFFKKLTLSNQLRRDRALYST